MRRGLGTADVVEARQVGLDVVALEQVDVVRGGADLLALTRRAVVGHEEDERVVTFPDLVERGQQPTDVLVDVVDRAGEDLHVTGEQLLLGGRQLGPRPHVVARLGVARRQSRRPAP